MFVKVNNEVTNDRDVVKEVWRNSFAKLYQVPTGNFNEEFKCERVMENEREDLKTDADMHLNRKIMYLEVKVAVDSSKNGKAVGVDQIANEILKNTHVIELLQQLFNACLWTRMIPNTWHVTIINPIPKGKPNSMEPDEYRGLSLQCCIYKILSSILNNCIVEHLDKTGGLSDEQNGLRKGRSCLHHIFSLTSVVRNKCNSTSGNIFAAFVDFRKAFDSTDSELMFCTLSQKGINGAVLALIKAMYTDTRNILHLNGENTEEIWSEIGLKQGDNLSPMCFSQFIDDLIENPQDERMWSQPGGRTWYHKLSGLCWWYSTTRRNRARPVGSPGWNVTVV